MSVTPAAMPDPAMLRDAIAACAAQADATRTAAAAVTAFTQTHTGPVDQDDLPPAQYLMMETLAARYRLGENHWTFPAGHSRIAAELARKGLVSWKHGVAERTIEVWLTDDGKTCCLSPTYVPPTGGRR